MKATCKATSNIAFVKYWGRQDDGLRLPLNGSISMNLSNSTTTTTVEFDETAEADQIYLNSLHLNEKQAERVFAHVDRIRDIVGIHTRVRIATQNNFPMGVGIASSASAFAALTVAAAAAANLKLSTRELSILARQGSGSAARSIPSGFVEWYTGSTSDDSFAEMIAPPAHWDIRNLIAIVQTDHKEVGSQKGNAIVKTSPFNTTRVELTQHSLKQVRKAILDRNWTLLGEEMEREAIRLHVVAMTSHPPIFYWRPSTLQIMQAVIEWRKSGLEAYFTIDAGANVHVLTQAEDAETVQSKLETLPGIERVIHNMVGEGAHLVDTHLF